jgi:hypothetical protein
MGEEHEVCAKLPLSSQWNQHYITWRRSMNVSSRRVKHLVFQGELIFFLKGIVPATQCFHG